MNKTAPAAPDARAVRTKLISSYVLVGEYGLLFLSAVAILLIVCWRSTSRLRTRLVYFYVITIVISLVRVVAWSIEPWWKFTATKWQTFLHSLLFALPPMMLVSTYTILISYWADEYVSLHNSSRRIRSRTRKMILIGVNILIYAVEVVVLTLVFWNSLNTFHLVQSQFLNVLYIFSVTAFILYGFGLYRTWRNTPIARKNPINISRMKLTLIITIVVSCSFTIRVVVNACWNLIRSRWWHYPFEVCFYTVVELVPIGLLLWLMLASGFRRITKPQSTFKPLIAQAGIENTDDEADYESGDDDLEPTEDTPGGLFD